MYRHAAEWHNYRSMFHSYAYVANLLVTGSIDAFIEDSKAYFEKGRKFMYILYWIIRKTVDVQGDRAGGKINVTVTCRFIFDGLEVANG